jgi:hypothetical protein
VLPRVSNRTIDLLTGLLTYNPQQRISAADALNMECFAPFRDAEARWEATDKSVPFAAFFCGVVPPVVPPVAPPEPPVFAPPAPELLVPVPPKPGFPVPSHATFVLPSEAVVAKPAVAAPKPAAELIESRLRASQRIKAYKDSLKAAKARKAAAHAGGPAVEIAAAKPAVFPKPRPEIVQPRLPKVVF